MQKSCKDADVSGWRLESVLAIINDAHVTMTWRSRGHAGSWYLKSFFDRLTDKAEKFWESSRISQVKWCFMLCQSGSIYNFTCESYYTWVELHFSFGVPKIICTNNNNNFFFGHPCLWGAVGPSPLPRRPWMRGVTSGKVREPSSEGS